MLSFRPYPPSLNQIKPQLSHQTHLSQQNISYLSLFFIAFIA